MFERFGRNLVKGAKAEIEKEPIHILDTERLIEWAEIAIPVVVLLLGLFRSAKKPQEPTTIVINNYIQGGNENETD
jgi:hypothetical protein